MKRVHLGLALLAVVSLSSVSLGQYTSFSTSGYGSGYFGMSFNNPMSAMLHRTTWENLNNMVGYKEALLKRGYSRAQLDKMSDEEIKIAYLRGSSGRSSSGTSKPKPASNLPPATCFKSTKKRVLLPKLIESLSDDPEQRKNLRAAMDAIIGEYEKDAANKGRANDMASALAFFAAVTYDFRNETASDIELSMIVGSIRLALDSPIMRKVSDLDKQNFYECMLGAGTYLMLLKAATDENDKESLGKMQTMAEAVLVKYTGIDPAQLKLTATGFVARAK